jgi:hypothetical protein
MFYSDRLALSDKSPAQYSLCHLISDSAGVYSYEVKVYSRYPTTSASLLHFDEKPLIWGDLSASKYSWEEFNSLNYAAGKLTKSVCIKSDEDFQFNLDHTDLFSGDGGYRITVKANLVNGQVLEEYFDILLNTVTDPTKITIVVEHFSREIYTNIESFLISLLLKVRRLEGRIID